jgi:hypothetical protein
MIMSAQQSLPAGATSLIQMGSAPSTADASTTIENDIIDCQPKSSATISTLLETTKVENAPTVLSSSTQSEASTTANLSNHISSDEDHSETDNKRSIEEVSMSAADLLEERRAKNRLSAHQSRLRKMNQLRYLQKQQNALTEESKEFKRTNEAAVRELAAVRTENAQLRMMAQQSNAARVAAAMQRAHGGLGSLGGAGFNHFSRHHF